jgi:phosphoribosylformylglycinamidine cyclo-ligase
VPKARPKGRKAAARKPAKKTAWPRGRVRSKKVAPKRASPAPSGVKVLRPVVHRPIEAEIAGQAFTVAIQKAGTAVPLDPATGLPAQAKATGAGQGATGPLTYAGSGVDIHKEDKAIEALAGMVNFARTGFGAPMGKIGHFAGLVDFGPEHALVLCTDGVGSKVEIANALRKWDTVGIDCMAMNVNDAICVGAEPLAFVDYLAVQDPDPELTKQIGIGLNEGARQGNCSLIGGETASLPGIIKGFDLAGTCMAFVKKSEIVDGTRIAPGDAIIGLASTGIHSNGYSLARRCFEAAGHGYTDPWPWNDKPYAGKRVGDVLLEPTRIYVQEILALLRSGIPVHGLSHITGSGLRKLRRINQGVRYQITDPLPIPPVFKRIQELGHVDDHEMYKTFNMGMGFAVVVPKAAAKKAVEFLKSRVKYEVKVVGKVAEGKGVVHPVGGTH